MDRVEGTSKAHAILTIIPGASITVDADKHIAITDAPQSSDQRNRGIAGSCSHARHRQGGDSLVGP